MLSWVIYSSLLYASKPILADFGLQCTDSVQLPLLAQRLVIGTDLKSKLDWSPTDFQQSVGTHQPVTVQFLQAGEMWKLSFQVGNEPDVSMLLNYFFDDVTVFNGSSNELKIFTSIGQFQGQRQGEYLHVYNGQRALDLVASGWVIEPAIQNGCLFSWQDMPSSIPRLNGANVAFYLPYGMSEISVQYKHPNLSLPDLDADKISQLEPVRSSQQPIAVLQLLSSPIALLRDDNMPDSLRMTDLGYAMLHRKLRIPGAQIGVFSLDKTEPDLLAVVPIAKKSKRKPVNVRRVWRWLRRLSKRAGWTFEDDGLFDGVMRKGDLVLHVRAIDGQLHLATQRNRLDTIQPDGEPWKVAKATNGHPVRLTVNLPQMMALSLGGVSQIQLGLSIQNSTVYSSLSATNLSRQSGLVSLLSLASQRLPISEQKPHDFAVVPSTMQKLALHAHGLHAKEGQFRAMDVFPPEQTDDSHPEPSLVSSNGWMPKEPLVGHYWIEVTKGGHGYLIHGVNESHEDEKIHWVMDETGNLQTIPFTD